MRKTAFWKQAIISTGLMLAAAFAWQSRAEIGVLWDSVSTKEGQLAERSKLPAGTPVIVSEVQMAKDDLTFSAIGTGYALRSVTFRAPSSGEITLLEVIPGRNFSAGDEVMHLDDTNERLAVQLAQARLERATSERDRYQRLQNTGNAAAVRIEDAETNFKVARIELDKARADFADRSLIAPFDGVSGLALIEVGDRVATDDPIATFDDRSSILVEFDLPEALLGRISLGLAVIARTPGVEDRVFEGEITAIDSRVNSGTRTARVRASIINAQDTLRPGASFSIRLDLPGDTYPAVPELALQFSRGALHVWRVVDGKVEQVEVRLVRRRAGLVIVDGPISAGDKIVVEGTQRLRPGVSVDVLNTSADTSS